MVAHQFLVPGDPIQHHFVKRECASGCGCHDEDSLLYIKTCVHIACLRYGKYRAVNSHDESNNIRI